MRDAKREWPVRVEKDFSYSAKAYAGDRWLLAGDAGSFLDPVFSTGVAIALESGLEAAARARRGARRRRLLAPADSRSFERRQRARYLAFRRFVLAFYTPNFRDLFFQEAPPRLFSALVTMFAGRWRPPFLTRLWVHAFFVMVWLQRFVALVPRLRIAPLTAPGEEEAA